MARIKVKQAREASAAEGQVPASVMIVTYSRTSSDAQADQRLAVDDVLPAPLQLKLSGLTYLGLRNPISCSG